MSVDDREWVIDAACRNLDPEFWFPLRPHTAAARREVRENTRIALHVCTQCPVRAECLDYALRTDTRYGTWGGYTERDRARLTGRKAIG